MLRLAITDYINTLENPAGVFRTLDGVDVRRDIYGAPELYAGNSSAIFPYLRADGERRFLKCYIRPNPHLRAVYEYVEHLRPALLPSVRLLREEMFVHTLGGGVGWVDVVEGEWTPGETLGAVASQAARAGDGRCLGELADAFDSVCDELTASEWAHGDLKPENIVVRPYGGMTLIDCDAMWIPALTGQRAAELGTPGYRHPKRTAEHFDKSIDDYSALLLSVSLRALALKPELYVKYNTPDILLFSPEEIVAGVSAAHTETLELFAQAGMEREYRMAETLGEKRS